MCIRDRYSIAIQEGHAALFAGAGLSIPSGFVNWAELLRPFANEINLSIDREHDYLAIAQYYYNEKGGNRSTISNEILRRFGEESKANKAVDIVTRLPIRTYWTTNYDVLIEEALKRNNRRPEAVSYTHLDVYKRQAMRPSSILRHSTGYRR